MTPEERGLEGTARAGRTTRRVALRGLGGGALAAAGLAGLTARAAAQGTPVAAPEILLRWEEGWSTVGDPSLLLSVVTEDVVYEDVAVGDVVTGAANLQALLAEAGAAIPDFAVTLQTSVATDEFAAAEYLISGTQTGDLPYLAATGASFSIRAVSFFELADGLIRRESRYYDMVQFLTQLGGLSEATLQDLGTPPSSPA
jgi:steroid delta-isomerase-like uncharacterized protein